MMKLVSTQNATENMNIPLNIDLLYQDLKAASASGKVEFFAGQVISSIDQGLGNL